MTALNTMSAVTVADLYLRISKDKKHDELATARQRHEAREAIEQRGWVLGREYCDNDITASKGKQRPQYDALCEALRAGEADVIVVTEISRLTRHMRELEDLVDLIEETGVEVHALRAGHIDLSTSGGRATARMLGVMARLESEQMSERIKSKMSEIARNGGWKGGVRPFGYDIVDGRLAVNRPEADLIRSWVAEVLSGRTVTSIATELNELGVPTVQAWTADKVKAVIDEPRRGEEAVAAEIKVLSDAGQSPKQIARDLAKRGVPMARPGRWTSQTVNQVLKSPRIMGYTSSAGEPVAEAHWEALIDRSDWERLQGVLATRRRGPTERRSLLAGLVWCDACGSKMNGASRGPSRLRVYTCQKIKGGCGRLSVSAPALDEYVVGLILGRSESANLDAVRAERQVKDSDRLVREIAEDEQTLAELAEDLGARRISRAEWLAARGQIEPRLKANRDALRALGAADPLPPGLVAIDDDTWDALPLDQQRAAVKLFIDRIVVRPIGQQAGRRFRPERLDVSWKA